MCASHAAEVDAAAAAEAHRRQTEEWAKQRADWEREVARVVAALSTVSNPHERLLTAMLYWTGTISMSTEQRRERGLASRVGHPGPLVFSTAFPQLWPREGDVDLDAKQQPWDSTSIASWFAAAARARGISAPEVPGALSRLFRGKPKGWSVRTTEVLTSANGQSITWARATIWPNGQVQHDPGSFTINPRSLATLGSILRLPDNGAKIVTDAHGHAWPPDYVVCGYWLG
jgi:hypothetical protein